MGSLAQHKEQRAGVGTHAAGRRDVEIFHVLLLVDLEVQAFHLVIHSSDDRRVLHLQPQQPVDFLQRAAHRHLHCLTVVLAAYFNGRFHVRRF